MTHLLDVQHLSKQFTSGGGPFRPVRSMHAVSDVSFSVAKGRVVGVVGESGCGKSTLARLILRLIEPTSGALRFEDLDLLAQKPKPMRALRARMQMVFQDPYSAIDPRYTIRDAVMEPFQVQGVKMTSAEAETKTNELLTMVGLSPQLAASYPHQLSGGQRQRVCIARALALNPQFIIYDESVSALDVSVQAGVLNLLKELQQEFNLTYIFISHDLSVVRFMSDRIMVMNKGKIEEIGTANEIINSPQSDYTRKLIASIPQFTQSLAS